VVKLIFLGTGGARMMMSRQLLATGGIWLCADNFNLLLDPGPGSLVWARKLGLEPENLDGIMVTHRHLDHCGDLNAVTEAMTKGGFHKKGKVFLPEDAYTSCEAVLFPYLENYIDEVVILKPLHNYRLKDVTFTCSLPHRHGLETYGAKFEIGNLTLEYIPDTFYFPELKSFYRANVLLISMLRLTPHPRVLHLSKPDVEEIAKEIRPRLTILTHFGLEIYNKGPQKVAHEMSKKTGLPILAPYDWEIIDIT